MPSMYVATILANSETMYKIKHKGQLFGSQCVVGSRSVPSVMHHEFAAGW